MLNLDSLTVDQISQSLNKETESTFDLADQFTKKDFRKASVLIPFVWHNNAWHILFIRRATSDKDRHSGQVAFVGGKAEHSDKSSVDTALRETHEEIGVHSNEINILGKLGYHYSISNFQITPVVATMPWPCKLVLDPAEVSHTFTLPLMWLADENNYEIKHRQPPESNRQIPVVYFNEYDGELLWGATARMILSLIHALKQN